MREPRGAVPGLGIVRAVAALVPWRERAGWRREWEAELAFSARRVAERSGGAVPPAAALRLRLRAVASVVDALWLWKETTMTGTWNDLRYAVRGLLRNPGFTVVAVLTLALGIGANTAVFTLVDGVVLSPLPFAEPERLVQVSHVLFEGKDELKVSMSHGLYLVYREQARTLGSIALYDGVVVNLAGDGEPQRVEGATVTPELFDILGASPAVGRGFTAEDGAVGAHQVVVLSHALWWERFGANRNVVGRTVDMDGVLREVIGVMPERFAWPDENARYWIPLIVDPLQASMAAFPAEGVARLADGATVESAGRELSALAARLDELRPGDVGAAYLSDVAGMRAEVTGMK
jgi:putative ABC transport system permease protein